VNGDIMPGLAEIAWAWDIGALIVSGARAAPDAALRVGR
jgi:hypothetical protein